MLMFMPRALGQKIRGFHPCDAKPERGPIAHSTVCPDLKRRHV